ncbi:MAG: transglutaminase-like domain-containing protein [Planctomycetia bacterium]|nr:transglutaminase-like domain-containing protein [Planctomycetia bacterium]
MNAWRVLTLFTVVGMAVWAGAESPSSRQANPFLGESRTLYWECGFTVDAGAAPCNGRVTLLVPQSWEGQRVSLVTQEVVPSNIRVTSGKGKLTAVISGLPAGETARVRFRYEVTAYSWKKPSKPSRYVRPDVKNLPMSIKAYTKPDPFIVSAAPEIRRLADETGADASCVWEELEEVYRQVREKVAYQKGPLKGVLAALREGSGDCEELSALFVAICRAKKIPARTVWVPLEEIPGEYHCYAEFYLENKKGRGYWFPCQPAGDTALGELPQRYVVLQKGEVKNVVRDAETQRNENRPFLPVQMSVTAGQPSLSWMGGLVQE